MTRPNESKQISKFLSLILRHQPQAANVEMDDQGWVSIEHLLIGLQQKGFTLTIEQLIKVVDSNAKQRFKISADGLRIRAKQGHSVEVELGLKPVCPPVVLRHGTPRKNLESIREQGLKKMNRHHVHLHLDASLAKEIGARLGSPIVLEIQSKKMHDAGFEFFVTENQVWLTDYVPPEFIVFPKP
ncbi:MAG: RNA 2'-phosphotransferase [Planctomycetota bacterium]